MVHVLVAIATRIAVATVILIVPRNEITLCLFVCICLFVSLPYLSFIYCNHHVKTSLHIYQSHYKTWHIYNPWKNIPTVPQLLLMQLSIFHMAVLFEVFLAGLGVLEINFSGLLNYLLQRVFLHVCIKSPNSIASSTQSELENLTGIRLGNYDNLVRQYTTNNGSYSLVSITFTTEPNLQPLPPPR